MDNRVADLGRGLIVWAVLVPILIVMLVIYSLFENEGGSNVRNQNSTK